MSMIGILLAAAVSLQPMVSGDVLEPSVLNEVEHALEIAPKAVKFSSHGFSAKGDASARAIALVSAQKRDGRWYDGTNDVTFAAVTELKKLAYGDGAFKVLMIGNSFSISNCRNMPQICESMGIDLELMSLYIGGCSLETHWQNVVASTNAEFRPYGVEHYRQGKSLYKEWQYYNIPEALKMRRWDVVTVQQCSHLSWKPESYHPWGDDLIAKIRELAPQAEIVVQETWSYTPWHGGFAEWGFDQNGMYDRLHAAYADFAAKHGGLRIIPTGTAVQAWRRELPVKYKWNDFGGDVCGDGTFRKSEDGKTIVDGDVFHLNRRGEYLQSLVWTAKLFDVDVSGCSYRPDFVSVSDAALMKRIANGLRR